MFCIYNKDKLVAEFKLEQGTVTERIVDVAVHDKLPIGVKPEMVPNWVRGRHALADRAALREYMEINDIADLSNLIKVTHAVSLNDTFWIKEDKENLNWGDVSPYRNDFNKGIASLSFDGVGEVATPYYSISPELSTGGTFPKCWLRENDKTVLLKRGTVGREPYNEMLSSQVFYRLKAGIRYSLIKYHNKPTSRCKLFTDEKIGYVPYLRLGEDISVESVLLYMRRMRCADIFSRILISDAITFNTDRHAGNFGMMFNTDTLDVLYTAPGFDYNLALFPNRSDKEFENVNLWIDHYRNKIDDVRFVHLAKQLLTPMLVSELRNLRGFEYEFDGDENFSKERVKWLTNLSNQQIDRILGIIVVPMYTSPNTLRSSNISQYCAKHNMSEEEFVINKNDLMNALEVSNTKELEAALKYSL